LFCTLLRDSVYIPFHLIFPVNGIRCEFRMIFWNQWSEIIKYCNNLILC
jgi:hypothetical protein